MKKYMKILSVSTLAMILGIGMVACDKKTTPSDSTTPSDTATEQVSIFTITFISNGGSDVEPIVAEKGTPITKPENPEREYYIFKGWYRDEGLTSSYPFLSMPNQNVTLYAKWEAIQAGKIAFDSCGGSDVESIFGNQGETITLPTAPTREGYDFDGWYKDENLSQAFEDKTFGNEFIILYAKWSPKDNYVTVNYIINDQNTYTEIVEKGESLPIPAILDTKDIVVENWYTDSSYSTVFTASSIEEDTTIYGSVYSKGLTFDQNKVVNYSLNANTVYVPKVVDGYVIDTIGAECFYKKLNLNQIVLPNSIEIVENRAFYGCSFLQEMVGSLTLQTIGEYAYYSCTRLENVPTLDVTSIPDGAFTGCKAIKNIDLGDKITSIGEYAFSNCEKLAAIELPQAIKMLDSYAFNKCTSLKEVYIPASLETLGDGVFLDCTGIEFFSVNTGNEHFKTQDGNLYNKLGNTLLLYIQGQKDETTFVIPSRVSTIKKGAFSGNTNLKTLDISAVSNVEQGALRNMKSLENLTINTLGYSDATEGNYNFLAYFFGADSGQENGILNSYVCDELKTVSIKGTVTAIEDYAFYGIRNLQKVEGLENVTSIGSYAFAYTALDSFKIEKDVEYIGEMAFANCEKLEAFSVARGSTYFSASDGFLYNQDKTQLVLAPMAAKDIHFVSTCTSIKSYAFVSSKATTLTIPETMTGLEQASLNGMNELNTLNIPFIGDGTEKNNYMAYLFGTTKSVTSTGSVSFDSLACVPNALNNINLTGELTKIDDFSFSYFPGLKNLTFKDTVQEIGRYAFYQCLQLENTGLNENIKTIGEYAYAYCIALTSLTIPGTVESIGACAFRACMGLTTLVIEEGIESIPTYAFTAYAEQSSTTGEIIFYSNLTSITLPSTLTSIGEAAFAYSGSYNNVNTPVELNFTNMENSKLTTIGKSSFEGSAIINLILPASVTTIEQGAFAFCPILKNVAFGNKEQGSKLSIIGGIGFYYCTALETFTIYKEVATVDEVPVLEPYASNGTNFSPFYLAKANFKIFVPAASYAAYAASEDWASYSSQLNVLA